MELEKTEKWIWWEKNVPVLVFIPTESKFFVVYYFKRHRLNEKVQPIGLDGTPLYGPIDTEKKIKVKVRHKGKIYDGILKIFSALDSKSRLVMVGALYVKEAGFKLITKQLYPKLEENYEILSRIIDVMNAPLLFRIALISYVTTWIKKEYGLKIGLSYAEYY